VRNGFLCFCSCASAPGFVFDNERVRRGDHRSENLIHTICAVWPVASGREFI
jgi:hypothetical protein